MYKIVFLPFLFICPTIIPGKTAKSSDDYITNKSHCQENQLNLFTLNFSDVQPDDVIIDEIMADPIPSVNLPPVEYIEIKNVSGATINLSAWKLRSNSKTSHPFPDYNLEPDSFLILTSASHVNEMMPYGSVLGISSFPALVNGGTTLSLIASDGRTIHAVSYQTDWYRNAVKINGGWSLEMIDTHNPCGGKDNWEASTDASGGTPGRKNSVDGLHDDHSLPALIRTYSTDSTTIIAVFNEPLDSNIASIPGNYILDLGMLVLSATPLAPLFNEVELKLDRSMQKNQVYKIIVNNIRDCRQNIIGFDNVAKTGWGEDVRASEIVINEILAHPQMAGTKYIELYNKTHKIFDASRLFLANKNAGNIQDVKKLSTIPFLIFPEDYVVVTENATILKAGFKVQNSNAIIELPAMPSYPESQGTVVITDIQGNVIDEVAYNENWQFPLITNPAGISLERIDPFGPSQDKNNWHSASFTSGYGTPTSRNSQTLSPKESVPGIDVEPRIFSPDNDGFNDITTIIYNTNQPGFVANVVIFNASGRMVRNLVKNNLLGLKGNWNWDGLDEKGQKLPIGNYIIYTEIFDLQGRKKEFKNVVTLAVKLR